MGDGVEFEEKGQDVVEEAKVATDAAIKAVTKSTAIQVTRMYKEGRILSREEADEEIVEIVVPPRGIPLAEVSADVRMTINMGNYESIQIGVRVQLPCMVHEIADCYKAAKSLVDLRLNQEVTGVRAYRDDRESKKV
jgi:hypothetical protein